ncbi:MAG: HD domain-containing protein [Ruminiclostridium sp.]|nr:HD domain-containing protein [Ruminiclostridium sp.]
MNYYSIMFVLSAVLTLVYAARWHKHFDVHLTLIYVLIPVSNLGYWFMEDATDLGTYYIGTKLTYIAGCFLVPMIMLSIFNMCRIRIQRWARVLLLSLSVLMYGMVLTIGYFPIYYKDVVMDCIAGVRVFVKVYGPMHSVLTAMIVAYFFMSLVAIIYSYVKKNDVSRRMIYLQFIPLLVSMISFYGGRTFISNVELLPFALVFAQVMYLLIVDSMCLYDISDISIESLVETGDTGFISIDFRLNYLGCNETAKRILPELDEITVDKPISRSAVLRENLVPWVETFRNDNSRDRFLYNKDDHVYVFDINYLFDGKRKRGYQLFISDDTKNQQYIALINAYNDDLKDQVAEKTANIVEMHNKLIMSMAAMVESRDNSTGGHIRRTSDVVRILIDEMRKDALPELTDEFCNNIIKAAPMHDLGKIAVDDAILRKPGRFTDEEFEKMKTHAAEGARIVHEILSGTDDINFHILAENVAHYHHERWDGSGYPEGLKGEEIPFEARIMAVADVYDALVSKRVYKESMSFEKADSIIMDGMGKHFDKLLEPYYVRARPKLEAYYKAQEQE